MTEGMGTSQAASEDHTENPTPQSWMPPRLHYWMTPLAHHVYDDPFGEKHLLYFLRIYGSDLEYIISSTTFIGVLATIILLLKYYNITDLAVSSTLIPMLGFIVGLGVSFCNA